jgi:hypothetical protein
MILLLFCVLVLSFLVAAPANAVCPVCTVAVGAGVGLTRYMGINDSISGVWIGGMIASMGLWTVNWLKSKEKRFSGDVFIIIIAFYLLTVLPLYWSDIIGHPFNTICGIDKIVFGSLLGVLAFLVGTFFNGWAKKRNGGKVYFPFQKVVFAVVPLIVLSIILQFCG